MGGKYICVTRLYSASRHIIDSYNIGNMLIRNYGFLEDSVVSIFTVHKLSVLTTADS